MSAYIDLVLAEPSLVSLWPLDELSGSSAADLKGSNTGTYVGSPTLGVQGAIVGDGSTAMLMSSSITPRQYMSSALTIPTAAITLEAATKGTYTGADSGLIGQWNSNGALLYLNSAPDLIEFFINAVAVSFTATGKLRNGSFHLIAGSWDGANGNVYFDGALVAGPTALSGPIVPAGTFYIGQYGTATAGAFDGTADVGALYSAALPAATHAAHYHALVAGGTSYETVVRRLKNPVNIH